LQHATALGWNVENKLVTETSQAWPGAETWYSYDPWGRRVMKDVNPDPNGENGGPGYTGGAWEFYFYGVRGEKLVTAVLSYNSSGNLNWSPSNYNYNVFFGRKLISSNGTYVVTDRLGSVRARDNIGPSGWTPVSYFPYGEERTATPDDADKFATYFRDGPQQDYAEQRYYNNGTGRFSSADPAGIKAANPANPTSWNRYAYVNGDPVNHTDRHGLLVSVGCDPDDYDCSEGQTASDYGGGCGGTYFDFEDDFDSLPGLPGMACTSSGVGQGSSKPAPPPPTCSLSVIVQGSAGGYHTPFTYHTVIQIDMGNGIDIDYEAFPVAKTAAQNPLNLPLLFGGSWLAKSRTTGSVQGTVEYAPSGTNVCAEDASITAAFASWNNTATSYYFYPQNSNSFAHWLLNQANVQLSFAAAFWMANHVGGWNWNPAGQGN
jgi:RHS repeat-associated protein